MAEWNKIFEVGLDYNTFLETHGSGSDADRWQSVHDQAALTDAQQTLLASFTRRMNVLCLAGAWCGDCVQQCPIFQRFAEASSVIDLRFVDRDRDATLRDRLSVNGGHRVPVVVFLSEDFFECGRYGDRTLAKYRELAASLGGAACPTGVLDTDTPLLQQATQHWLDEFERIQLMLRLSPRLRSLHGD